MRICISFVFFAAAYAQTPDPLAHAYEALRVHRIAELLRNLGEEDQEELARMLDKLRTLLERGPAA